MKYALCLQPYIPMRSEASERSEMVSQLLFGDTFRITDEVPHWFFIERDCDGYTGWIDWKTAVILSELDYLRYVNESASAPLLRLPYNQAQKKVHGQTAMAWLPWGARIFNIDDSGITFHMEGIRFDVSPTAYVPPVSATSMSRTACAKFLVQQAQLLLNVPYLWGGCSAFGLDCSGFAQTLFRFIGIALPRNASQQAECGTKVAFEDRLIGDLAFFGDGGKVSHVGLVGDNEQIVHVSGALHIDELRKEGIYSATQERITHKLISVRRLF